MVGKTPLKIFGLTDYEERAYLTLVRLGTSRAAGLAKETKIPRQKIYEVLESLNQKGFINVVQGEVRLYSVVSPMFIEKLLTDNFEEAKNFLDNLKKIEMQVPKEDIWVIKGERKIFAMVNQFLKGTDAKQYVNYLANDLSLTQRHVKDFVRMKKKGVDVKIIANNEIETKKRARIFQRTRIPIKFLNSKYIRVFVGTYDDKLAGFGSFDGELMIVSNSKFFIDFTKSYFELLWKTADS